MRQHATWVMASLGLAWLSLASGCGKSSDSPPAASIGSEVATPIGSATVASAGVTRTNDSRQETVKQPTLVVIQTSLGAIKVRLFDDKAPVTVDNFLENYVVRDFYHQTVIHHVESGFMIAAGGYSTDMQPKVTRAWIRNESSNGLSNRRGTLAMARHPDYPHSATSQFFINLVDNPSLDYRAPKSGEITDDAYGYCVFGEIIEGLDVVDKIAAAPVKADSMFPAVPVTPILIESIKKVE